ncbi:hypothetical protein E2C01_091182 [Portunus trituberculatus]|uniref:Uncharacterized protein n=1 Tax=Portunus trituberculatus TaxID=210409 RepID=A0A5B7JIH5_PORTR|nr:hypothetical protein [Portunus trituberculatus]
MEEGHFTCGQQRPPSSPDSEVGSDSEVDGDGGIDNVAEGFVGPHEDPRNEAESESTRKRPQWWTDYMCESDDE